MKIFKLCSFLLITALVFVSCRDSENSSASKESTLLENPVGEIPETEIPGETPKEEFPGATFGHKTLNSERSAWEAQGIDNYTVVIKQMPAPEKLGSYALTRVSIKDSVYLYSYDMDLMPEEDLPKYFKSWLPGEIFIEKGGIQYVAERWESIANVYDIISELYEGYEAANKPLFIEVKYNTEYHYPEYVSYTVNPVSAVNINNMTFPKSYNFARESFTLELSGLEITCPLPKIMFDLDAFNREWAAWKAQGINNYSFNVKERGVSSPNPINYSVTVAENIIVNITNEEVSLPGTINSIYEWFFSFYQEYSPKLGDFEYLDNIIHYNELYHYPELAVVGKGRILNTKKGGYPIGGVLVLELSEFKISE